MPRTPDRSEMASMRRNRLQLALTTLALAAAALVPAASASHSATTVTGTVGPGFTITLTQGGKKVTKLPAGKVTFVINDKATIHNFELDGPNGFAKKLTDV